MKHKERKRHGAARSRMEWNEMEGSRNKADQNNTYDDIFAYQTKITCKEFGTSAVSASLHVMAVRVHFGTTAFNYLEF
eukprot:scaffold187460_cov14-Prasinocladus_malaysianus.AAC.1